MKLKITTQQFKRLLEKQLIQPKFPITMDLSKVSKEEAKEIVDLLKEKRT